MRKVLIVASYLVFFVLGGLTFTYLTSTEAANGTKKISVVETAVNYFVDNVKKHHQQVKQHLFIKELHMFHCVL